MQWTRKRPAAFRGVLPVIRLSLGIRGNRGKIPEVIVFAAVGDGFQVFRVTPVGDAHARDLPLLCHVYRLMFRYNGIVGKLIPSDSAALFHKPNDAFRIGAGLGDLIQCIFYEIVLFQFHHSFGLSVYQRAEKM